MKKHRDTKQARITVSKQDCFCSECDEPIEKGEAVEYNPQTKTTKCSKCFKKK